jgi:endo-1,4-beta-xylanase
MKGTTAIYVLLTLCCCRLNCSTTLKELAAKAGVYMGSCQNGDLLSEGDQQYSATLWNEYDLITPENSCKWAAIQPEEGVFTFDKCDIEFSFAHEHNQKIRGHNLCWGKHNPSWLEDGNFSSLELADLLRSHIDTVLKRYGSRAFVWDVVNEALSDFNDDSALFGNNVWYPALPNYVDIAFQQAAASRADSLVKLFYNDYLVEKGRGLFGFKSDNMFNMIKDMRQRGIPVDGVGLQFHIDLYYSGVDSVQKNLERYDEIGIEVHITELDVGCEYYHDADGQTRQAEVFAAVLQACLDVKACTSFETWGFTDLHSWRGVEQHPLPFDESYMPKLAYQALTDTLQGNKTWVQAYYRRLTDNGTAAPMSV